MNDIIMYGSAPIAVIIVVIMLIKKKWILKSHCLPWVLC